MAYSSCQCDCRAFFKVRTPTEICAEPFPTEASIPRFLIAPFDVVKIRLQLQSHGTGSLKGAVVEGPTYNGILGTARTIVQQEGVTGLWKGNVPAEVLYMTYSLTQFLSYQRLHRLMANTPVEFSDSFKAVTAGATAGGIATTVTYPWDLLRTRFAAQGREKVFRSET
jgi:solute carrier family 25 thiamine pyrophosphate transporter 19